MSRKRRTSSDEEFIVARTSSIDLPSGSVIDEHVHDWHQLIWVRSGLAIPATRERSWMAPPNWAVWMPARQAHGIRFVGASELRTVYIRPDWGSGLPNSCRTWAVSALLSALVLRSIEIGMLDRRDARESAIAQLIVDELARAGPPPFSLPQPSGGVTAAVAFRLQQAPDASVADLLEGLGLSVRTFERRFVAETGMTFGRWRQHKALLRGLEQVAAGASIKAASVSAGYQSSSAFVAAFRKAFGISPGRYFFI